MPTNGAEPSPRPYGLWDAKANQYCRGRFYQIIENAHHGAQKELRFRSPPGRTLELINRNSQRLILTYVRRVHSIEWR